METVLFSASAIAGRRVGHHLLRHKIEYCNRIFFENQGVSACCPQIEALLTKKIFKILSKSPFFVKKKTNVSIIYIK